MPNWTEISLSCDGLKDLPIFTNNSDGEMIFDFNKITEMPSYVRNTISPVQTDAVLNYIFKEFSEKTARKYVDNIDISFDREILRNNVGDIINMTECNHKMYVDDGSSEISSYDLGKNYYKSKSYTGCWDWYDWACKYWGVKWNACDSYICGDVLYFNSPWYYPEKVFKKMADMFPEKTFYSEIIFEDEYDTIYTIDFCSRYWCESKKENN